MAKIHGPTKTKALGGKYFRIIRIILKLPALKQWGFQEFVPRFQLFTPKEMSWL